jgi:nitrate/TMAO reductase-like tetraheme cytochrome c subunit
LSFRAKRPANNYHSKAFVSSEACADCHEVDEMKTELALSVHPELACSDCHAIVASNLRHMNKIQSLRQLQIAHLAMLMLLKSTVKVCMVMHYYVVLMKRRTAQVVMVHIAFYQATNRNSMVHPANVSNTCSSCHDDPDLLKKFEMSASMPGQMYNKSVHAKLIDDTQIPAATCVSCHGVHNIKSRLHPIQKLTY